MKNLPTIKETNGGISMATETLGAHFRNLLTPYKNLLCLVEDVRNGKMDLKILERVKCNNIDALIEFSHSDKMENVLWRDDKE